MGAGYPGSSGVGKHADRERKIAGVLGPAHAAAAGDRVGAFRTLVVRRRPGPGDRVLQASEAARSFGLVKGERLMASELLALARQVRRDGEIREGEFEVSAGGASAAG